MCAKFRFSISSRCDDIVAEVKGVTLCPPPAAGGWRGGPAAAGLTTSAVVDNSSNAKAKQCFYASLSILFDFLCTCLFKNACFLYAVYYSITKKIYKGERTS